MSPDPRSRRKPKRQHDQDEVRTRPSPDDAHDIVYFRRRREEDAGRRVRGQLFLRGCPANVHARIPRCLLLPRGQYRGPMPPPRRRSHDRDRLLGARKARCEESRAGRCRRPSPGRSWPTRRPRTSLSRRCRSGSPGSATCMRASTTRCGRSNRGWSGPRVTSTNTAWGSSVRSPDLDLPADAAPMPVVAQEDPPRVGPDGHLPGSSCGRGTYARCSAGRSDVRRAWRIRIRGRRGCRGLGGW
jgi:hypothetical protein